MDVLFLAYANSSGDPLPTLSREDDGVFSVLVNRQLKGHFLIHRESFATLDKINTYLGKYQDRLAVFLYSGHAGGQALLLDGEEANARGIAHQLGEIARKGKLRLVVLNGCSTAGQVQGLLDAGVPAVVATSAPVDDRSATEFSIRFFQCLGEKRMSIGEAFEEALGPAQTAAPRDLGIASMPRGIRKVNAAKNEPLWGLFASMPEVLDDNPLPRGTAVGGRTDYVPNEKLTQALFRTLLADDCRDIRNLQEREDDGEYVEIGDKQTAIVNVLPFPVSTHLQKLLTPVEGENEGFDKVSLQRLKQAGTVYHTTVELMAFVLLAQLWELKLQEKAAAFPPDLVETIRAYFYLPARERAAFDYLPFIRAIRRYLDSLPRKQGEDAPYFVKELGRLKDLLQEGHAFAVACGYLGNLRRQAVADRIDEADVPDMCAEAEEHLCAFFAELGFLHRYTLTSIQNIDIRKYRHQLIPMFSHEAVKLMRAFGKPEKNYYVFPTFLDNRGVALIKGKVRVLNARKKEFTGEHLAFLNLSPFVIDRNAFEANTDLANLLFFEQARPNEGHYRYINVKRPESPGDRLEVQEDSAFEAVFLQLEAFRAMILNENADAS